MALMRYFHSLCFSLTDLRLPHWNPRHFSMFTVSCPSKDDGRVSGANLVSYVDIFRKKFLYLIKFYKLNFLITGKNVLCIIRYNFSPVTVTIVNYSLYIQTEVHLESLVHAANAPYLKWVVPLRSVSSRWRRHGTRLAVRRIRGFSFDVTTPSRREMKGPLTIFPGEQETNHHLQLTVNLVYNRN